MKVNHVHHIAVNTKNIDESIAFYRDIMGFSEASRADMGSCVLVYMKVADDCFMELFDVNGGVISTPLQDNSMGCKHIAFDVDSIAEWNAFLKSQHIPFLMDVVEMPQIGKRAILISDPNGVVIELNESM